MPSVSRKYPLPSLLVTLVITAAIALSLSGRDRSPHQLAAGAGPADQKLEAASPAHKAFDLKPNRPSSVLEHAIRLVSANRTVLDLFGDPAVAGRFHQDWQGKLPAGSVSLELPDEVDAGAENGHEVPVRMWVAGTDHVVGLEGRVRFTATRSGFQIKSLQLTPIPLAVSTWQQAVGILKSKESDVRDPKPATERFYGQFTFRDGAKRLRVNALSAAVELE